MTTVSPLRERIGRVVLGVLGGSAMAVGVAALLGLLGHRLPTLRMILLCFSTIYFGGWLLRNAIAGRVLGTSQARDDP